MLLRLLLSFMLLTTYTLALAMDSNDQAPEDAGKRASAAAQQRTEAPLESLSQELQHHVAKFLDAKDRANLSGVCRNLYASMNLSSSKLPLLESHLVHEFLGRGFPIPGDEELDFSKVRALDAGLFHQDWDKRCASVGVSLSELFQQAFTNPRHKGAYILERHSPLFDVFTQAAQSTNALNGNFPKVITDILCKLSKDIDAHQAFVLRGALEAEYGNYHLFATQAKFDAFAHSVGETVEHWLAYLSVRYVGLEKIHGTSGRHVVVRRSDLDEPAIGEQLKAYFSNNGDCSLVLDANVESLVLGSDRLPKALKHLVIIDINKRLTGIWHNFLIKFHNDATNPFFGPICSLTSLRFRGLTELRTIGNYFLHKHATITALDVRGMPALSSFGAYSFQECHGLLKAPIDPVLRALIKRFPDKISRDLLVLMG